VKGNGGAAAAVVARCGWFELIASGLTAALVLAALSGCASRTGNRFVHPGKPVADFGTASPVQAPPVISEHVRQLRELQSKARPKSSVLPTIEARDPRLAAALLRLAAEETAANHRRVAAAYIDVGIPDYAYRHYRRALRLEPCDAAAYDGLARLWREWEQPDLALGDTYRALHCAPLSAGIYNTLGTVMQALGQDQNAKKAFDHALRLDPAAVFALSNLCYLSLQVGDDTAAEGFCGRALVLDPTNAVAANNLALAYAVQGDVGRAETLLLDNANKATGHYNVGVLRLSLGRYAGAAQAFDQAIAARPSFGLAHRRAVQARVTAATEQKDVDR
jgi:Flp pilus assembly protein TadD